MTTRFLDSDGMQRHQPVTLRLYALVTAIGILQFATSDKPKATIGTSNGVLASDPLSQISCDAILGVTGDVNATLAFGAVAMGTDAYGICLDMEGQTKSIVSVTHRANVGPTPITGFGPGSPASAPLGNAIPVAPTLARAQVTPLGNIVLQGVVAGLDAAPVGTFLEITLQVILK